jgi:MoxR-like ATPase
MSEKNTNVPMKGKDTATAVGIQAVEKADDGYLYIADSRIKLPSRESFPEEVLALIPDLEKFRHYTLDKPTLENLRTLVNWDNLRLPGLLEGDTAVAKISPIFYLAALKEQPVYRFQANGQTDTSELIGKFVPNDGQLQITLDQLLKSPDLLKPESKKLLELAQKEGRTLTEFEWNRIAETEGLEIPEWRWQDGYVPLAAQNNAFLILDEWGFCEPQIRGRLHSILEDQPSLVLTENGGKKIEIGEHFRVFATNNPDYNGVIPFTPAELNRWQGYKFIHPPSKNEYSQMLVQTVYGEQPDITLDNESFAGEVQEAMHPQLAEVPNFRLFLPVLAQFHSDMVRMASSREIGKNSRSGYVFTRRDILSFLNFIANKEIVDRKNRNTITISDDPKRIICEALREFYTDKAKSQDDRKKIEDLLSSLKLTESNFCVDFFATAEATQDTKEKVETTMGDTEISQKLDQLSEGRYLSPEALSEALGVLGSVELPSHEINRLNGLLPTELTPEIEAQIQKLKDNTEEGSPPLIQQIPKVFIVDGVEKPFTIAELEKVWKKAKEQDSDMHPMYIGDYVNQETKDKVWESGKLRAYTSKPLEDSKNKSIEEQREYQKTLLGENAKIGADMYFAMLFRYLASGKTDRLLSSDVMRLDDLDKDGDSLRVYSFDGDLCLDSSRGHAYSHSGLGASVEFSS